MKDSTIKYKDYIKLGEEEKSEVDFWLEFGVYDDKDYLSNIPIEERNFITVKMLQDALIKEDNNYFAEILDSIEEYSNKNIIDKMTYEVVISFRFIINRLIKLLEVENEMLNYNSSDNFSDIQEQVDFSMFPSYYNMLNRVTDGDITKFKQIENMKYSDVITQLIYLKKQDEFQELVAKRNMKKQ